jgi:hypothetical protein
MMHRVWAGLLLAIVLMASGCAATRPARIDRADDSPAAPTASSIFFGPVGPDGTRISAAPTRDLLAADATVTPVGWFEPPAATQSPAPTPTRGDTPTPAPTPTPPVMITRTIYADGLDPTWTLENSQWMSYTEQSEVVHSGDTALLFQPEEDFSSLYFTVRRAGSERYPYRQVMGVGLWLNPGPNELELDALALTVVGSNEVSYWKPDDNSVQSNNDPVFSETRLYFLGFNRPFPPDEWTYVELWLDDLLFDPMYEYVTGFYIKNDRGFFQPVYLDDVHLIMLEEPL